MTESYYNDHLAARRLRMVYELATTRVRRYLDAEIEFVRERIRSQDMVLELGCGYGRVLESLAGSAKRIIGIDTSESSLKDAKSSLAKYPSISIAKMNATRLGFPNGLFDAVICIQNGMSAFHVDPKELICECARVTRKGGLALLSSYSECFWEHRLEWFKIQSANGLIGELDEGATGDGVIVCRDGFHATTFSGDDFRSLCSKFNVTCQIYEVDKSSVFCEIMV